jgi:hypothetical protein
MSFDSARALIASAVLAASAMTFPGRAAAQTRPAPQPQTVPSAAPAAEPPQPPGTIQFGATERVAEALAKDTTPKAEQPSDQKKGALHALGGLAKKGLKEAEKGATITYHDGQQDLGQERFAELFIKISDPKAPLYIHAIPVDPITGARRDYKNLESAKLRVVVLNEEQHNKVLAEIKAEYQAVEQKQFGNLKKVMEVLPTKTPEGFPTDAASRAKFFDVAEAINLANLDYQGDPLDRKKPTVNGNAAITAMLEADAPSGVCVVDRCDMITETYSANKEMKFTGINTGLAGTLTIGKTYQDTVVKIIQQNAAAKASADKANAAAAALPKTPSPKARTRAGTKATQGAPATPVKPIVAVVISPEDTITTAFKTKWPLKEDTTAPTPPQQNPAQPATKQHAFG